MPVMIVRHEVEDYRKWKAVFDSMNETRKGYGWTAHEVYRSASDPNHVTIVNHMRDVAQAKAYGASDTLKNAMARAGVMGPPDITVLDEADSRLY
jgi:quinol monooxygenase YgiN